MKKWTVGIVPPIFSVDESPLCTGTSEVLLLGALLGEWREHPPSPQTIRQIYERHPLARLLVSPYDLDARALYLQVVPTYLLIAPNKLSPILEDEEVSNVVYFLRFVMGLRPLLDPTYVPKSVHKKKFARFLKACCSRLTNSSQSLKVEVDTHAREGWVKSAAAVLSSDVPPLLPSQAPGQPSLPSICMGQTSEMVIDISSSTTTASAPSTDVSMRTVTAESATAQTETSATPSAASSATAQSETSTTPVVASGIYPRLDQQPDLQVRERSAGDGGQWRGPPQSPDSGIIGMASDVDPDPNAEVEYLMTEATMEEVARYFRVPPQLFTEYSTIDGESLLLLALRMNSEHSTRLLLRICPSLICALDRHSHTVLNYLLSIVEPQRLVRIFSSRFSTPPYFIIPPVTTLTGLDSQSRALPGSQSATPTTPNGPERSPARYLLTLLIHDINVNDGRGVRLLLEEGMRLRGVFESMTYKVVEECMASLGFPTAVAFNAVVNFCASLQSSST